MSSVRAAPVLLSLMVGLSLVVVVWGVWQERRRAAGGAWAGAHDDVLLGMVALAAFAFGVFITYLIVSSRG